MRFLSKRLDELTVVDRIPDDHSKVFFGAYVTVENDDGEEHCYQIVGPDEFDIKNGKLSMDSPLAKLLLGKHLDDEVVLRTPEKTEHLYITQIEYKPYI